MASAPSAAPSAGVRDASAEADAGRRPDVLERAALLAVPRPELQERLARRDCDALRRPAPCWGDEGGAVREPPHGPPLVPRFEAATLGSAGLELRAGTAPLRLSVDGAIAGPSWTERAGERWVLAEALPATDVVMVVEDRRVTCFFMMRDASSPRAFALHVAPRLAPLLLRADVPVLDANHEARAARITWDSERVRLALDPAGMTYPLLAAIAIELAVPSPPVPPQPVAWRRALEGSPGARDGQAMAYDAARKRVVLFGGSKETLDDRIWEYDGTWHDTRPVGSPWTRRDLPAAYDAARKQTVFFGGADSSARPAGDTWLWDGAALTRALPALSPPRRHWSALAYDASRSRTVLVGGTGAESQPESCHLDCDATWEWDGAAWTRKTPAPAPAPRWGSAMTYDATRRRVVLFGGGSYGPGCGTSGCNDTWDWDGTTWSKRASRTAPSARTFAAMAFDASRGRAVLFGGMSDGCKDKICSDTWEWDGATWTLLTPPRSPGPRAQHAMAYDAARRRVVLYGGSPDGTAGGTWDWDGVTWTPRWQPPSTHGAELAFDPAGKRMLLFGGDPSGDGHDGATWLWDGKAWEPRPQAVRPPARRYHAMATDLARQRVILFGGESEGCGAGPGQRGTCGDTWSWDGARWSRSPLTGPPARYGHTMTYDEARKRVVLFGGTLAGGTPATDTWEHDGQTWTRVSAAGPAATWARMAYDAERSRVVLYASPETWEWDGATWVARPSPTPPPARRGAAIAYDRTLRRVVLFGGASEACRAGLCDDLWQWDGATWAPLELPLRPGPRSQHAMAWDAARSELLLYGGLAGSELTTETWTLTSPR